MKKHLHPLIVLFLISGCTTAHIPVPESLTKSTAMTVSGRQGWKIDERLAFGPYSTNSLDRSWTRGRDLGIAFYRGSRRRQTLSFILSRDGGDTYDARCEGFLRQRTLEGSPVDISLRDASQFECRLRAVDRESDWTLTLKERGDRPLEGTLSSGHTVFRVEGTRRLDGALPVMETTGYYIRLDDTTVAAVETVNDGAVWLDADLPIDRRDILSAAAAALLLVEDLRGHLHRES